MREDGNLVLTPTNGGGSGENCDSSQHRGTVDACKRSKNGGGSGGKCGFRAGRRRTSTPPTGGRRGDSGACGRQKLRFR